MHLLFSSFIRPGSDKSHRAPAPACSMFSIVVVKRQLGKLQNPQQFCLLSKRLGDADIQVCIARGGREESVELL